MCTLIAVSYETKYLQFRILFLVQQHLQIFLAVHLTLILYHFQNLTNHNNLLVYVYVSNVHTVITFKSISISKEKDCSKAVWNHNSNSDASQRFRFLIVPDLHLKAWRFQCRRILAILIVFYHAISIRKKSMKIIIKIV